MTSVKDFIGKYKNHPILFIGTELSKRYLLNSYSWEELLLHSAMYLKGSDEYYLDIKYSCQDGDLVNFYKIASKIDASFTEDIKSSCDKKFSDLNKEFYENMRSGAGASRFKIHISRCLSELKFRNDVLPEVAELKKARKNIGSVVTTNYDRLIENIFDFNPLIGNDILLSNPYGSVYKIHGCVSAPSKIIITEEDYVNFNQKHELIKAQLLSLFIHNPIIFIGYSITDENIKSILKTIFTYVEPNSSAAARIRENFLLVEYECGSFNEEICEHDIDVEGHSTIRINKIKTDNFSSIYKAIADLVLPVSAMDIRKVQKVFKDICEGGSIQVKITEDIDSISNSDRILAIGSTKAIKYEYQTPPETIKSYFSVLDEENIQIVSLIDKFMIASNVFFPIFGFRKIKKEIARYQSLRDQQILKLKSVIDGIKNKNCKIEHCLIDDIIDDDRISVSNKVSCIVWNCLNKKLDLDNFEKYLRNYQNKETTDYRKMLCAYDFAKYAPKSVSVL